MSVSGHVVATEKSVIGEDSLYFLAQEINEALIDHGVKPGNGAADSFGRQWPVPRRPRRYRNPYRGV